MNKVAGNGVAHGPVMMSAIPDHGGVMVARVAGHVGKLWLWCIFERFMQIRGDIDRPPRFGTWFGHARALPRKVDLLCHFVLN